MIVVCIQVASFTGEKRAIIVYNKFLQIAYHSGVHEGIASRIDIDNVLLVVFGSYVMTVWFGAKMILEKGYTRGNMINVIVVVRTGSLGNW